MARPNSEEIVVVLDRSGSMASIARDMEGGFDRLIEDQKTMPGEVEVSLYQFDTEYEIVYEKKSLEKVPSLSLVPRGSTALLDAVGKTIASVGERLLKTPEAERPEKVMFMIITDGQENASREYTKARVKEMVEHQTNVYKWQFIYLGANVNAFDEAAGIGIRTYSNYAATPDSVAVMTQTVSASNKSYRAGGQCILPDKME